MPWFATRVAVRQALFLDLVEGTHGLKTAFLPSASVQEGPTAMKTRWSGSADVRGGRHVQQNLSCSRPDSMLDVYSPLERLAPSNL
jgi:hypothetical protein